MAECCGGGRGTVTAESGVPTASPHLTATSPARRRTTHLHWLAAAAGRETRCSSVVLAAGGTGAVGP